MYIENTEKKPLIKRSILIFILKVFLSLLIIWLRIYHQDIWSIYTWLAQFAYGLQTFLIPSIILSIIRFSVITFYHARNANKIVRSNFVIGVDRLTAVANAICAGISLMIMFGINPKEFITSLTIVAMAIAVTFRDYITNMISGLIIMFSDQLNIGDRIRIGNHQGRIIDITLANIVFQDEEDDIVMVPNNLVFTTTFTNLSAHQSSLFSVRFELPLDIATEVDRLEEDLRESLQAHPNLDQEDKIELKIVEIGRDFVKYKIDLHAVSYSNKLHKSLQNEILKEVLKFQKSAVKPSSP